MVATHSTTLPIGTKAPDFRLRDTEGKLVSLQNFNGMLGLVVAFICNHCPYVKLIRPTFIEMARHYQRRGISFVAISSNDAEGYPQDGPEKMREEAVNLGFPFPYLYDETQEVAKAYKAACTPDIYVFDRDHRLVYHGQFDPSRPGNGIEPTGSDLKSVLDTLLTGEAIPTVQIPSIGCNIKWKPGNEPDYAFETVKTVSRR